MKSSLPPFLPENSGFTYIRHYHRLFLPFHDLGCPDANDFLPGKYNLTQNDSTHV